MTSRLYHPSSLCTSPTTYTAPSSCRELSALDDRCHITVVAAPDNDGDGVGDTCDVCYGDDDTGDADGTCADLDCDDGDPELDCTLAL